MNEIHSAEAAAAPSAPSYYQEADSGTHWALFPDGQKVRVAQGRSRWYPGLAASAPPTGHLYRLAGNALPTQARLIDAGCGAGIGLHELSRTHSVIGIDLEESAVEFARKYACSASVTRGDIAQLTEAAGWNAALLVDVLGHVADPFQVLRSVRSSLPPGGHLFIAEPTATPSQVLIPPAYRAFSQRTLASMLSASGFSVMAWVVSSGPFLAALACRQEDDGHEALFAGARALSNGDADRALAEYERAARSQTDTVRFEATLAEGDLRVLCGDGDGACNAYFRAREQSPNDPRPLAGLAQVALAAGEYADALVLATRALSLDPTEPSAACAMAEATEAQSAHNASPAWRRAHNLMPDNLAVAIRFARAARQTSDFDSAIDALERVREYSQQVELPLHLELAETLLEAGRQSDAQLELDIARTIAPDDPDVQRLSKGLAPG